MKNSFSFTLTIVGVAAVLAFSNCRKSMNDDFTDSQINAAVTTQAAAREPLSGPDRLDEIMKDLSVSSYSFSFSKPLPSVGITRTAYGADNYLLFADPQDLICPEPIRLKYKRIPVWKNPIIVIPTCPDMAIDISRLGRVSELLQKADPAQFKGLQQVALRTGGALLATPAFFKTYSSIVPDQIDKITADLNPERFLLLHAPAKYNAGFNRSFYGYADLNKYVFSQYRLSLKDILKPTLKGCFDPLILKTIRERLIKLNPAQYSNLAVTPLEQSREIAVLR